ncbi:MAG: GatB/YqeY domain-containing protein [bacterium]
MSLADQIKADLTAAMKNKEPQTVSTLRLLTASIKNKAIELKKELEDAEVIAVIKSDVKKLQDALGDFTKAARDDLSDQAKTEIEILKKYLPPEMEPEKLEKIVRDKLDELDIKDMSGMGKAMGSIMADVKDAVDGYRVKETIEKILKGGE